MRNWLFVPIAIVFIFIGCSTLQSQPRLVVFISVDQGMPGLLEKYDHLFTGGYRWLKDNGVQFSQAYHEHGYTSTGPGHFVLSSGRHPGKGGVFMNDWYDRDSQQEWYCVQDTTSTVLKDGSMGRSYQNIKTDALGDWLKNANPKSNVISVAGKDRSSILLGGKNPDAALWYDRAGGWTTSTYYNTKLPRWVKKFNSRLNIGSYVDSTWGRLVSEDVYTTNTRADNYYGESDWTMANGYSPTFPIEFKEMGLEDVVGSYLYTPFGDNTVLKLGLSAVDKYKMGKDKNPDILFLGLSATDGVGHSFGPHSHEQLDNYLRLDKNLGEFIQMLESKVGTGNVLYVLSSDHGAFGLPEYLQSQGIDSGRIPKPKRDSLFTLVTNEIDKQIGPGKVTRYGNFFYYNNSINPMEREVATEILKSHLSKLEGIHTVITKEDMLKGGNSVFKMRLKNMVHPEKSPDVYLITKKYWTWKYPVGASHGSPYDYDTHVPLIFSHETTNAGSNNDQHATVDIAPSIAHLLDVKIPEFCDGSVIKF